MKYLHSSISATQVVLAAEGVVAGAAAGGVAGGNKLACLLSIFRSLVLIPCSARSPMFCR